MIDLNKKYSFININGTTFKNFCRNSTISRKKNVSSFFKKEILGVSNGKVFFYGAARMGIYEFIKSLNLKKGDEVAVTAFTCSVVINSIKRFNLNVKYIDIDKKTLGTSFIDLKSKISKKTKLIIAQHSFGIPCDIDKIVNFAKSKKILVLEDCAISILSTLDNKRVGTFGDASIFSFDHTKPLNCFVGGALYLKNKELIKKLSASYKDIDSISPEKTKKMILRHNFETKFCNYNNSIIYFILNKLLTFYYKISCSPFLDEDINLSKLKNQSYPYPSLMPIFAFDCLKQSITNYKKKIKLNNQKLNTFVKYFKYKKIEGIDHYLSLKRRKIHPFRFVWLNSGISNLSYLSKKIDINQIWFKQVVINTSKGSKYYGYKSNSCKNSENICKKILNIPNTIPKNKITKLLANIYE
jgi:perosamine synthetase